MKKLLKEPIREKLPEKRCLNILINMDIMIGIKIVLLNSFLIVIMTLGILMGALWAKEAWGHYWSWDPKETWAAVSWFSYLVYIHYRRYPLSKFSIALWILIINFIILQMCWWGVNYLPSAQGMSIHTYNMN